MSMSPHESTSPAPASNRRLVMQRTSHRVHSIDIGAIDCSDQRFQLRLHADPTDLLESIEREGQRTPVILWGAANRYVLIDGFRRVAALSRLDLPTVAAVIRKDLDEDEAYALSFSENSERKSLSPLDRASAVWRAIHERRKPKEEVAEAFRLSVRQIDRYLSVLNLDEVLQCALRDGAISLAHAVELHRAKTSDLAGWIEQIQSSGLSAAELRKRLRTRRRSRRTYLVSDSRGFRLRPVRYRADMSAAEKRRIWDALESAMRIIARSSGRQ